MRSAFVSNLFRAAGPVTALCLLWPLGGCLFATRNDDQNTHLAPSRETNQEAGASSEYAQGESPPSTTAQPPSPAPTAGYAGGEDHGASRDGTPIPGFHAPPTDTGLSAPNPGDSPVPGQEVSTGGEPSPALVPLRLTAIGDVNFNRNRLPVHAEGVDVWGEMVPFETLTQGLRGWIDGDVNFANIETVVTSRNDFDPPDPDKSYCFRSHPNGVARLIDTGFNLFCLANNHAYDYGDTGIRETLANMARFAQSHPIAYAGIGMDFHHASTPAVLEVHGVRIGMVAIGIGGPNEARSGPGKPGVAHVSRYKEALERLRDADVDIRILSIHDGKEGILYPIDRQILIDRVAIRDYDVDIVLGHHPHRVQGVERYGDGIIFYSLGNGIMRGAANIGGRHIGDLHADFGLLARIDMVWDPVVRSVNFRKIEAIPIYDMHSGPHVLPPESAAARIDTLNRISELSYLEQDISPACPRNSGAQPLVFRPNGSAGVVTFRP